MTDQGLAAVADSGLDTENYDGPDQQAIPESDYVKVAFKGVNYDSLSMDPKIGDEHTFLVRGRIVETGERALHDGHVQAFAKIDVRDVVPYGDDAG